MPKPKAEPRSQLNVRLEADALDLLEQLRVKYGERLGSRLPVSQSTAVDVMIRSEAKREGLKGKRS